MKYKIYLIITLVILIGYVQARSSDSKLPDGFVYIDGIDPSIVLDMRYYSLYNFVGKRIDGYSAPKCIMTRQAAQALREVQEELKQHSMSLKIYDAYRPTCAVDHFVKWAKNLTDTKMKTEFYPNIVKKDLFPKYIGKKSSHSRGSTVDITIVPSPVPEQEQYVPGQKLRDCTLPAAERFKDNSIDMGTGFDCYHELSVTLNSKITPQQRANRMMLKTIMEKHGFKNYMNEWWHYTLKNEPFRHTYFNFEIR